MKKGALLINLGSPDSTEVKDVKNYLDQFLMDKRVIDYPYLLRAMLVKGIILRTRPPKSAAAYQKVWTNEGSPLIVHTQNLLNKVKSHQDIQVEMAMRYGQPSIPSTIKRMYEDGVRELFVIPLYPQYAMSTTETVLVEVEKAVKKLKGLKFESLAAFYKDENYLNVLGESVGQQIQGQEYDKILFSFHGLPERHIYKTDSSKTCRIDGSCCFEEGLASHPKCYRHQCYSVVQSLTHSLNLDEKKVEIGFQSRLGRDKWLDPSTEDKVDQLLLDGSKKLIVASPAFVADCLETLEELNMELRSHYLEHGGESFHFVECLNSSDQWAKVVSGWIDNWKAS